MKLSKLSAVAAFVSYVIAVPTALPADSADVVEKLNSLVDDIQSSQIKELEARNAVLIKRGVKPTCTLKNLSIRKE